MRKDNRGERPYRDEQPDLPKVRHEMRQHDHHGGRREAEEQGPLELLQNLGHLLEEGGVLGLLGGGAPGHVDAEHVADDGLGDVQADAAEEDGEDGDPAQVLEDGADEVLLADAVA